MTTMAETNPSLSEAITIVKAAGYRVTKLKAKAKTSHGPEKGLNAIGKPYSATYDPNYRMQYRPRSLAFLYRPMPKNTPWIAD